MQVEQLIAAAEHAKKYARKKLKNSVVLGKIWWIATMDAILLEFWLQMHIAVAFNL